MTAIEQILETAASTGPAAEIRSGHRPTVAAALWICACVTTDDAPTWLIYETATGDLGWRRVPDGIEPLDLVDARSSAGGHADPAEVLRWLNGDAPHPWPVGGAGNDDSGLLEHLLSKIHPPE